ncbi:glycosyltransferase [Orrella marina]|uniref:Glycosyltransferase n=1 Tax=Orrella marina TaxID=2163011 RepID=A0A2R4XPI3_9BURK|nr:glycosyltransferase [Orrella marina]
MARPASRTGTALIILAKAPVPGFVKTRLIPAVGSAGAAAIAESLLTHTLGQAIESNADRIELCASPEPTHPSIRQALDRVSGWANSRLHLSRQPPGDLGHRMDHSISRLLAHHGKVLLIGTDAPALTADKLRQSSAALDRSPAVFVPAYDGGYALVGMTTEAPFLFENMAWSTPAVMATTRQRLREQQWSWTELDPVHDIDEPQDLAHLPTFLWPAGVRRPVRQEV